MYQSTAQFPKNNYRTSAFLELSHLNNINFEVTTYARTMWRSKKEFRQEGGNLDRETQLIFEAMDISKWHPENFITQSTFSKNGVLLRLTSRFRIIRKVVARLAISTGSIYKRPTKVDPTKPRKYRLQGWLVRNMSQREDGTYFKNGGSNLKY